MIKFTKDTLTIEIKDYDPIEYLFNLQSAILKTIQQINWLEMQLKTSDFQKFTDYSNANYKLLELFKELQLTDFESNPEQSNFIFNSLQDDIKKQPSPELIQVQKSAAQSKAKLEQYIKENFATPHLNRI